MGNLVFFIFQTLGGVRQGLVQVNQALDAGPER
jgi:hypothetical protein